LTKINSGFNNASGAWATENQFLKRLEQKKPAMKNKRAFFRHGDDTLIGKLELRVTGRACIPFRHKYQYD
jgi:hypothetical protein